MRMYRSILAHAAPLALCLMLHAAPSDGGMFDAWACKTKITFTGYTGGSTLSSFPVLIKLSTGISGFNYGDFSSANGNDLRFSTADGSTELNYEVDTWNVSGTSYLWVQVPVLTSSNDFIYAYWGNTSVAASRPAYATNGAAWESHYTGVYHLGETLGNGATGGINHDSSANGKNGTQHYTGSYASGVIGGAQQAATAVSSQDNYINFPGSIITPSAYTKELWYQYDGNNGALLNGNGSRTTLGVTVGAVAGNHVLTTGNGDAPGVIDANQVPMSWVHCVVAYDAAVGGGTMRMYTNGVLIGSVTGQAPTSTPTDVYLFSTGGGWGCGGQADELRLSSSARSADWIMASYRAAAPNGSFVSVGAVQRTVTTNSNAGSAGWVAYDDCAWTANSTFTPSANDVTGSFTTNSPLALVNGNLRDTSNINQSVTITFATNAAMGLSFLDRSFAIPSGSDAATWFAGRIGTNGAATWSAGTVMMTLNGMNPAKLYSIVLWSTRGADGTGYSNRFTDITISGADSFTNKSSAGTQWFTNSMANDRTRVRSALAPGLVAQYDGINPGADGSVTFALTAGADMLWAPTAGATNAYLNAVMIQEYGTTSVATAVSTNYVWHQGQITGTMNADTCSLYLYTSNNTAPVYVDDVYMCHGSTAESGANLITNPGFESGTNGWEIVGNFLGLSQPVTTPSHSGAASLLLQASAPVASGGGGQSVKQFVTGLTSGGVHTLSFWYYATNAVDFVARYSGHPAMVAVTQVGAGGTAGTNAPVTTGGFAITGQWTPGSNSIHLAANTTPGKICRVMWRDSFAAGSWQQYGMQTAGVSSVSVDIPITATHRYFQIVETALGVPLVDNASGASSVGTTTATLNGNLSSTGALPTTAYVCWDTTDKGAGSTSAWAHVDTIGVRATGAFSDVVSGLSLNAAYAYRCFAANAAGSSFASSAASFTTEPGAATGLGFSAVTNVSMTVSWSTNGTSASGSLVVMEDSADPSSTPVDGVTYAGSATYGSGNSLGGGYVVMSGAGTSVNVSGLTAGYTYYVRVYTYVGSGASINYKQSGPASGSQATTQSQVLGPNAFYLIQSWVSDQKVGTVEPAYVYVASPVPGNHTPNITSITANPSTVAPFGTVNLSVAATDMDGDPLKYGWVVTGGELAWSRAATETWTAPSLGGTYKVQVLVGDGKTWTNAFVNVTVSGNGTESVGNHPPAVYSMVPSKVAPAPGETITFTCTASDRDAGDVPDIMWNASDRAITNTSWTVSWTAPTTPTNPASRIHYPGFVEWTRQPPADCPFPMSTGIVGVALMGRCSLAQFSDTWMATWGNDGNLYSTWQDGVIVTQPFANQWTWFDGVNNPHNGWAQIVGNDPQDLMLSKAGLLATDNTGWIGRYPNAIVHKDGVLYYGTRLTDAGGTMYPAGPNAGFSYSLDNGDNWTASPHGPSNYLFGNDDPITGPSGVTRLGQTYLVDYGQNQNHSPDGKVYFVSAGTPSSDNSVHVCTDDAVYLCRVTASTANINNKSAYEVYAGNGNWSSTISAAQPIAIWTNHFSSVTITYNPGLNKYIMSCHKANYSGSSSSPSYTDTDFDSFFLESSSLTGPYNMVQYSKAFGPQAYYLNMPSKFISTDGKSAWLWYGANFAPFSRTGDPYGSGYRMTQQQIRFLTPGDLQ